VYTYDFDDSWGHQIVVEKRLAAEPGRAYPACLTGERHGPPEDCGGIPGFYNLLGEISDPEQKQQKNCWSGLATTSLQIFFGRRSLPTICLAAASPE
jgi:Plasmid pRiA4b ORF-3-like protein